MNFDCAWRVEASDGFVLGDGLLKTMHLQKHEFLFSILRKLRASKPERNFGHHGTKQANTNEVGVASKGWNVFARSYRCCAQTSCLYATVQLVRNVSRNSYKKKKECKRNKSIVFTTACFAACNMKLENTARKSFFSGGCSVRHEEKCVTRNSERKPRFFLGTKIFCWRRQFTTVCQ